MPYPKDPNYTVIHTDYENFSVVYNCEYSTQQQIIWILSRTPVMEKDLFQSLLVDLKEKLPNFDFSHFDGITYQGEGCSYN